MCIQGAPEVSQQLLWGLGRTGGGASGKQKLWTAVLWTAGHLHSFASWVRLLFPVSDQLCDTPPPPWSLQPLGEWVSQGDAALLSEGEGPRAGAKGQ